MERRQNQPASQTVIDLTGSDDDGDEAERLPSPKAAPRKKRPASSLHEETLVPIKRQNLENPRGAPHKNSPFYINDKQPTSNTERDYFMMNSSYHWPWSSRDRPRKIITSPTKRGANHEFDVRSSEQQESRRSKEVNHRSAKRWAQLSSELRHLSPRGKRRSSPPRKQDAHISGVQQAISSHRIPRSSSSSERSDNGQPSILVEKRHSHGQSDSEKCPEVYQSVSRPSLSKNEICSEKSQPVMPQNVDTTTQHSKTMERARDPSASPAKDRPHRSENFQGNQSKLLRPTTPPLQRDRSPARASGISRMKMLENKYPLPSTTGKSALNEHETPLKVHKQLAVEKDQEEEEEMDFDRFRKELGAKNVLKNVVADITNILPSGSAFSRSQPKNNPALIAEFKKNENDTSVKVVGMAGTQPAICTARSVLTHDGLKQAQPLKTVVQTISGGAFPHHEIPTTATKHFDTNIEAKPKSKEDRDPLWREKRSAALIVSKELNINTDRKKLEGLFGKEITTDLPGTIVETEQKQDEEEERKLKKIEAEKRAKREEQRLKIEADERARLLKVEEERVKKLKRDAEREKQEAAEAILKEKQREETVALIRKQRQEQKIADEKREKEIQRAKEKGFTVQCDAEHVEKLKAQREESKKQALSLQSASKVSGGTSKANVRAKSISQGGGVMDDELSLFVEQESPTENRRPHHVKTTAQANLNALVSEREASRIVKEEAKMARTIQDRWDTRRAANHQEKSLQPPSESTRPVPTVTTQRPLPGSKPSPGAAAPLLDGEETDGFLSDDVHTRREVAISGTSKAPKAAKPLKSGKKHDSPIAPQLSHSRTQPDKQAEIAKTDRTQKEYSGKRLAKSTRNEQQKAERRRRDTQKARSKKEQQLIKEAQENGIPLTDDNLNAQVELFMAKRERDYIRRHATQDRRERVQEFAPDSLSMSVIKPPNQDSLPAPIDIDRIVNYENITEEERLRLRTIEHMNIIRAATAKERGAAFRKAARITTVDDLQESDSESEEDPDIPEPSTKPIDEDGSSTNVVPNEEDWLFGSDGDDDEGDDLTSNSNIASLTQDSSTQPNMSFEFASTPASLGVTQIPHARINVYEVKTQQIIDNEAGDTENYGKLCKTPEEANELALKLVSKWRAQKNAVVKAYSDKMVDGLTWAKITYATPIPHEAIIFITKEPIAPDQVKFRADNIPQRLPEKSYLVHRVVTQRKKDPETGQLHVHHDEPEIVAQFSELEMANTDACIRLCEAVKPRGADYVQVAEWDQWRRQVQEKRDEYNAKNETFVVTLEKDETTLLWLEFDEITFRVQLLKMQGPRN